MRRDEVIKRLKDNEQAIRTFGVKHLHLYGSCARNEAGLESDVDLFFDRDYSIPIGLFELIGLKEYLEGLLGEEVDVGTRTGLHPVLRSEIEHSAIKVF
jgi:hypothetical protein